jgi:hypothetical protein
MPLQLWPDPRDGLDPQDAPWNWTEIDFYSTGPTRTTPNAMPGWQRWYFWYRTPTGDHVKVSADRDPQTGQWFNPHPSTLQQWP